MLKLNRDELIMIGYELGFIDIINLCKSSQKINKQLCENRNFWINKLKKDYDIDYKSYDQIVNPYLSRDKNFNFWWFIQFEITPRELYKSSSKDLDEILIRGLVCVNIKYVDVETLKNDLRNDMKILGKYYGTTLSTDFQDDVGFVENYFYNFHDYDELFDQYVVTI